MGGNLSGTIPQINKSPPLNGDYNRDPNISALKRKGVVNHWATVYPQAFLAANGPPDLPDRLPAAGVRSRV